MSAIAHLKSFASLLTLAISCFGLTSGMTARADDLVPDQWGWQLKETRAAKPYVPEAGGNRASAGTGQIIDGSGDTFGSTMPALDLLSLSAYYSATDLTIMMQFSPLILPCEGGMGVIRPTEVSVNGFIDLDTDQNAATGNTPFVDVATGGTSGLGMDYYLDLCSYSSSTGQISLLQGAAPGSVVGSASALFSSNVLTLIVPLSALGGDDGMINLAATVGTMAEMSDAGPSAGFLGSAAAPGGTSATAIPTLSQWALLMLSLVIVGLGMLRFKRCCA